MSDLQGDDSYIVGAHPQCGASSANLQIPKEPFNKHFPYNNSLFLMRLNTPYGTFADGNPFPIAEHYEEPWSRADTLARKSWIVSIVAVIITVAVAFIPIYWEYHNKKKHKETKDDLIKLESDTMLLKSRVTELIKEEVQRRSRETRLDIVGDSGNTHQRQATPSPITGSPSGQADEVATNTTNRGSGTQS
ncbi:hypothetical protein GGI43DRAFT_118303 [Trichoderma evansii]